MAAPTRYKRQKQPLTPKQAASIRLAIIISTCAVAAIAVVAGIVGLVILLTPPAADDRIIDNVYAAGINLGGMTKEEAKNALHLATDNTYSAQDMVINLPDDILRITPQESGAVLDVDGVVEEAFSYGRTGSESEQQAVRQSAANTERTIALLPYLDLNLSAIQNKINAYCSEHSSKLEEPNVQFDGGVPTFNPDYPNSPVTHATLTITMGLPEYTLKAAPLYDLVRDYYSLNKLTINYAEHQAVLAASHTDPAKPNAQHIFNQSEVTDPETGKKTIYCFYPKDAVLDEITYEITNETYGYGFDVAALQKLIDKADYGQVIRMKLKFLMPQVTAKDLGVFFKDTLSTGVAYSDLGKNWFNNASLACAAINNYVIKPGEEFSFNLVVGQPTSDKGYKKGPGYLDGKDAQIMGSGISQTATALFYSVLKADLAVVSRYNHTFVPNMSLEYPGSDICMGLDAYVDGTDHDLVFINNTSAPIRIHAKVTGSNGISVTLMGTNNLDYFVELEIVQRDEYTKYPNIIHQYIDKNNVLGYTNGQILQEAIIGYGVDLYRVKYSYETGQPVGKDTGWGSAYECRDQIVAEYPPDMPIPPTDPDQPDDPTDPELPDTPANPDQPDNPTDPQLPADPQPTE